MSVGVHQRALYNRSSLCDVIEVPDGQSQIFLHAKRASYCKMQASQVSWLAASIDISKRKDIKKCALVKLPSLFQSRGMLRATFQLFLKSTTLTSI